MSGIYKGSGWLRTQVGVYENGEIFSGYGWTRTQIGEYENGKIFSGRGWTRSQIGEYEGDCGGAASALLLLLGNGG